MKTKFEMNKEAEDGGYRSGKDIPNSVFVHTCMDFSL